MKTFIGTIPGAILLIALLAACGVAGSPLDVEPEWPALPATIETPVGQGTSPSAATVADTGTAAPTLTATRTARPTGIAAATETPAPTATRRATRTATAAATPAATSTTGPTATAQATATVPATATAQPAPTLAPTATRVVLATAPPPTQPPVQVVATPTLQPEATRMNTPAPGSSQASRAIQIVAERTGIPPEQLSVVAQEEVDWPDSSLGCPQPGANYLQVITPGVRIVIQGAGQTFHVHGDTQGHLFLCTGPQAPASR
jgi:hypothetical protein